jgi:hypothetical protein
MTTPIKRNNPSISVSFDPAILERLSKGNYNASKLINSLLTTYFSELPKKENK